MPDRIQASLKIRHWHKSQRALTTFPDVRDAGTKTCTIRAGKLNPVAHPKLAARLHQRFPLPCVRLLGEQHFNPTWCRLLFIRTPASSSKETSWDNARVIQHQHVSCSKVFRKVREDVVSPCTRRPVKQKHPRVAALFGRLLRY